ncbi:MAG: hypothetical protein CVU41_16055 [Chloroflexi bacterium HGW-Chloroflexi-3]|nr:MAG: hypothetical protein CVU41_16055 [Chloroflexi bacterium HGW-Chloroflexi-3]
MKDPYEGQGFSILRLPDDLGDSTQQLGVIFCRQAVWVYRHLKNIHIRIIVTFQKIHQGTLCDREFTPAGHPTLD